MLFLLLIGAGWFADIQKIGCLLQTLSQKIITTQTFLISAGRASFALLVDIDNSLMIHNKRIFYPKLQQKKAFHKIFNETAIELNVRYFSIENRKIALQKRIWENFNDHSKNKSKS